jgi:uncharacterized protein (DUF2147 family)
MNKFFFLVFCFLSLNLFSQSITGKWKTIDDETGEVKSIVEIYEKDGKYYGKVIEIMNKARKDAKCEKCTGSRKNKSVLNLVIITDMKKDGDEFNSGKILDTETGKEYKCNMSLESKNKLKVRGFIGFSLIGRTQYWHRI